jgi:hypothetical protein
MLEGLLITGSNKRAGKTSLRNPKVRAGRIFNQFMLKGMRRVADGIKGHVNR